MITNSHELNRRERALLRAVAIGRAELSCSCEPTLFVDGFACCDQGIGGQLIRAGLLSPAIGRVGARVPARLTAAGHDVIDEPDRDPEPPATGAARLSRDSLQLAA